MRDGGGPYAGVGVQSRDSEHAAGAPDRGELGLVDVTPGPAPNWLLSAAKSLRPNEFIHDPVGWASHRIGAHLWSKQAEVARSVVENKRTAVPSAHAQGKSWLASMLACWWVETRPPGEAIVVTTAPTSEQVHSILWEEIRSHHRKHGLIGKAQRSDRWVLDDGTLVGMGRKPPDHSQSAFQGIHKKYVLVLADEACGIPLHLWEAIEAITTSDFCRILAIGNPDDNSAPFAHMCLQDPGWNVIRLSALESPNLTGERVPEYLSELLVSADWVDDKRRRWGENSPLFKAKVEGIFADKEDALIPLSWVTQAQHRWERHHDIEDSFEVTPHGPVYIGVDVARFGADRTCIATRQGDLIHELERRPPQDTMATAFDVELALRRAPHSHAIVDVIGIGAGVLDKLRQDGYSAYPFNASAGTGKRDMTNTLKFPNLRSAAWWNMRELLDPANDPTLALPPDDELAADLTAPGWRDSGGKIIIEAKDAQRKSLGRSTDAGDAVVMSCWRDLEKANARRTQSVGQGQPYVTPLDHLGGLEERTQDRRDARVTAKDHPLYRGSRRSFSYRKGPGGWT